VPDRKRAVVVCVRTEALRYEQLTRYATDRSQDALVVDTSASELPLDHLRARVGGVDG
jgi:hypothetical protein